jgi:ABC-2 type transport system ATP-binding protein
MVKNSVLEVEGLSKRFNQTLALNNVNLNWNKGILGLIGPNGAGKSTLIKILSTLLRPTKGRAAIFGKDISKEPLEVKRRIGVLHENPAYHPNLRVMSSLKWVAELRGYSRTFAQRSINELLDYFDLLSAKNNQIKELSAGMKQKYGIIQATVGTPPFIILDEPTSNLDPDARRKYEAYVTQLSKEQQCSFLISSHVLGELNRICEGFVFLFNGTIAETGTRNDLIQKPSSQRFRISTLHPKQTVPFLAKQDIIVEQVKDEEIIVVAKNFKELTEIRLQIPDKNISQKMEIFPLETEIDSLYRELSKKCQVKEGE